MATVKKCPYCNVQMDVDHDYDGEYLYCPKCNKSDVMITIDGGKELLTEEAPED